MMMSVDAIGDFLTIIRNGVTSSRSFVTAPYSVVRNKIADILHREGFIKDVVIEGEAPKKILKIYLKYHQGESVIHAIERMSTPGRRLYSGVQNLKPVIGGFGVAIVTTSQGIMTDKQAHQLNVGGEVICTIW
jgi:small subunit ribosomal protein S8